MRAIRVGVVLMLFTGVLSWTSMANAAPKPNDRCQKAGRERVTAAGTLRCQSVRGVLRWRLVEVDSGGYKVGDVGPGGGIVFYVAPSTFASPGSDCASSCRYLEAAPATSGGDPLRPWATDFNSLSRTSVGTSTGIGSGMANTIAILEQLRYMINLDSAARYAYEYGYGGKTDWHLPSKDELNELFKQRRFVGGFASIPYWSSSEASAAAPWCQAFFDRFGQPSGYQSGGLEKAAKARVRPVRAF